MDVGGVVGAAGWRDGAVVEDSFVEGEQLAGGAGHEHDVDESLADVVADL